MTEKWARTWERGRLSDAALAVCAGSRTRAESKLRTLGPLNLEGELGGTPPFVRSRGQAPCLVGGGVERSREPDLLAQMESHGTMARVARKRRTDVKDPGRRWERCCRNGRLVEVMGAAGSVDGQFGAFWIESPKHAQNASDSRPSASCGQCSERWRLSVHEGARVRGVEFES
jgi:hypothetical protein